MNIKKGNPLQKGSTKQKDGYNFAIASAAEIIDLLLYAPKADEPEYRIELTEAYKTGDVFSVHISGIYLDRYLYCYEADGATYKIWLEDSSSIEAKLKLMEKYQLGGVAAWKLGFERADVWSVISQYLQ